MDYFFYGTLMDPDVRALVLSPAMRDVAVEAAVLEGYRRVFMRGRVYPVVIPARSLRGEGVVARGLGPTDGVRLAKFESDEYDEVTRDVMLPTGECLPARVFVAGRRATPTARSWELGDWQRRHKQAFCRRTRRRGWEG